MQATAFSWPEVAEDNPIQLLRRRRIAGEKMLVARVFLEKGCQVATHNHESEQIAIVMSGHVRWGIGVEGSPERREIEMRGGEVMLLPSNVFHSVDALEDTEIIDVLSPPGAMGIDSQDKH
jgi:quercetin dioxygenase-like cupin family protein